MQPLETSVVTEIYGTADNVLQILEVPPCYAVHKGKAADDWYRDWHENGQWGKTVDAER